jgi:hypothetical protein
MAVKRRVQGSVPAGLQPRLQSGFMAKEYRSTRGRKDARTADRKEKSEAPTLPPPPPADEADRESGARGDSLGRLSGTFAISVDAVIADLRRDPRCEK